MALQEQSVAERLIDARERYVARGAGNPKLVVGGANGAIIEDLDGREYLDFVGGIGCQNLGHGPEKVVAAVHAQVDRFLHQMSMVVSYEGYVEVCRLLAEVSPCAGASKSMLINSGAEAVENAVKISRSATRRPAVLVFDRAFHGRTLLAMTMTSKLVYKKTFGPFAPEIYRVAAPYEYRGISSDDAIRAIELAFKSEVDPESVACAVLEPVQGEGGFIPMTPDFPKRLHELLDQYGILYVDDEVQSGCGRTGPVWAIEHYGTEPDLLVSGKTLGGGLPLAAVTGRAELMDAPHPGGLGGTFGGNPVACAAALAVLEELSAPGFRERADQIAKLLHTRLDEIAARHAIVGEVRGLGAMLALELTEQNGDAAKAVTTAAREKGLVLLSCGLYGNVIRLLPPLSATDEELERGLGILEEALGDASSG